MYHKVEYICMSAETDNGNFILGITGVYKYCHLVFSRPAVKRLPKWDVRQAERDVSSLQSRPVRRGTLKPMPRVQRVPRSLHAKHPCNNSFRGPQVAFCKTLFLSLSNIPSFSSGSPNFPDHHPRWPILYQPTYCIYCELVLVLNMHEIFAIFETNSQSIMGTQFVKK